MGLTNRSYLQVNQALFSLAHAYESRMDEERARNALGLKVSDCSVLMVMGQFAPLTSRKLSRLMDINPGTISVYVQRLVEMGLVRKKQDSKDRRNWRLDFTPKGRQAALGIGAGAVEYTRDFLSGLNTGEQQELHRLLLKVSHSLGFEWQ
ncbi:MAG: MarR family transcriptional regulator [Anaerolineales bacterium]